MKQYLVEAVGTFFVALAIILTGGEALAIGLMVMAMMYMGAHISGGHFNPIVTVTTWARGGMIQGSVLGYLVAQAIGALATGALVYVGTGFLWRFPSQTGLNVGASMVLEFLVSFVFASAVLAITTTDRVRGSGLAALLVGLSLTAAISIAGVLVNPALGVCSLIFSLIAGDVSTVLNNLIIQIIGALLGAVIAAVWFKHINKPDIHTVPEYR